MVSPVPSSTGGTAYKKKSPKGKPWSLGFHTGQDFEAKLGAKIVNARPGTVIARNAYDSSYGYRVEICSKFDGHHYHTRYCHMPKNDSYAKSLKIGQVVPAGVRIGSIGISGNTSGPHCHVEVRSGDFSFKAANFRDPKIVTAFKIPPVPAPIPPVGATGEPIRHFYANVAILNDKGRKTYPERFPHIADVVNMYKPHIFGMVELANLATLKGQPKRAPALMTSLLPEYTLFGQKARYIGFSKEVKFIASGIYETPASASYKGDAAHMLLLIHEFKGKKGITTCSHYEADDPTGNTQVKQYNYFHTKTLEAAKKYGVSLENITEMFDANSENKVRNRANTLDFYSAFQSAGTKSNGSFNTFNEWKKPRKDNIHIDYVMKYKKAKVKNARQINDPVYTDHGMLVVDGYQT